MTTLWGMTGSYLFNSLLTVSCLWDEAYALSRLPFQPPSQFKFQQNSQHDRQGHLAVPHQFVNRNWYGAERFEDHLPRIFDLRLASRFGQRKGRLRALTPGYG